MVLSRNSFKVAFSVLLIGSLSGCYSADHLDEEASGEDTSSDDTGEEKPTADTETVETTDGAGDTQETADTEVGADTEADFGCNMDTDTAIDGRYQWHTFFNGDEAPMSNVIIDSEIDSEGNLYVLSEHEAVEQTLYLYSGTYLSKLNSTGETVWRNSIGDTAESLALDNTGNIFISATGEETDVLIYKYDTNGNYIWHSSFGNIGEDTRLTVDGEGNIIIAGLFILKLDAEGNCRWREFFDGVSAASSVTTDPSGNIFLTGSSSNSWEGPEGRSPIDPHSGGLTDIFVLKLNPSGSYEWHTFFGSGISEDGDSGRDISVHNGDVVVTASVGSTTDNPQPGDAPIHPHSDDLFHTAIIKLSSDGERLWHTFYPGSPGAGHSVDGNGNIYITGSADADWEGPNGEAPLNPYSTNDAFIVKVSSSGEYQWHTFFGAVPGEIDLSEHTYIYGQCDNQFIDTSEYEGGDAVLADGCGKLLVLGHANYTWQGPNGEEPLAAHSGSWCHGEYYWELSDTHCFNYDCGPGRDLFVLSLD